MKQRKSQGTERFIACVFLRSSQKLFRFIYNGKSGYALGRKRKMVEDYFEKVGESPHE